MPFFYASEINNRTENQDYYCHMEQRLNHEALVETYIVADGMGGMADGGRYARNAVLLWYSKLLNIIMGDDFRDHDLNSQTDVLETFARTSFQEINQELYKQSTDTGRSGGTTLSVAIHFWDSWIFANVGDSPIYYYDGDTVILASELQNIAGKMVREHVTQEGTRLFYQNKNRLLEYLGKREPVHPHVLRVENQKIQMVLLGSDGAFGNLKRSQLEKIFRESASKENIIPKLFALSRASGEDDNQTALLYRRNRIEDHAGTAAPDRNRIEVSEPDRAHMEEARLDRNYAGTIASDRNRMETAAPDRKASGEAVSPLPEDERIRLSSSLPCEAEYTVVSGKKDPLKSLKARLFRQR